MSIPLGNFNRADSLVWTETKSEVFSVSSAYNMELMRINAVKGKDQMENLGGNAGSLLEA